MKEGERKRFKMVVNGNPAVVTFRRLHVNSLSVLVRTEKGYCMTTAYKNRVYEAAIMLINRAFNIY